MKMFFNHPYHLVTLSPWPLLTSLSTMIMMSGSIMMFNYGQMLIMMMGLTSIILCSYQWWRDMIRESTFQGSHTKLVTKGLKLSMILFILSELLFFISFFWTYLHSALSPNIEIGAMWPPLNINQFNPYQIPFLNTILLLSSGFTITLSHHSILNKNKSLSTKSLLMTIFLGMTFSLIQMYEYLESSFTISDSIYGSIFFMTTGFHGLHVIIGTIFLIISYTRLTNNHLTPSHHFGFEAATWYWHFVDIIWIIVYTLIYWWPF
uniref:Cytochrome c oxidase subunit 3 n=1 Tax=Trybliographa sp. ZJUH 20220008 TaxID=2943454 RepID=A0A9E8K0T0_9HYME|nr:cytochrome c oxidase subunit 3 [Trybliographa sp. ZJUH 20220008]